MNLWLRSQDRKMLLKPNFIEYEKKTVENKTNLYCGIHRIITFYNGIHYVLGEYKTQKRALEVLDEIQEKIKDTDSVDFGYEFNYCTKAIVYDMPEE